MKKISFLGAGSMAEAMISGLLQAQICTKEGIVATNRSNDEQLMYLHETYGINTTRNKRDFIQDADIIVLACKPKDASSGVSSICEYVQEHQLIISVMAGIPTSYITQLLGKNNPIIRVMPNTSATIGKSATAISASLHANEEHVALAHTLFTTIGVVQTVEENDLDAVTGLSGSGPAYVYYLVEAMEKAAQEIGLDHQTAKPLILQTIIGAAEMLKHSQKHPSILRKEVTSQGGTTEAGIATLQQYNYEEAMIACIKNATKRSKEMGEVYSKEK
ncbi:pyrroline-5-carboxylate reductase ProI [Priestia taiwanensis]|uniref:Pyrroline-5-carboxylate reductase n=1 Tax=Priestia taiwanensis TaxID=1347902 RepID=A0A917ELY4_9BACI|nr:pyrroline-5-carboxylate reductase ProI [Priestia taiwanensis]MBM7361443.1 pyrroline-5-carboxylate reductase [Priestia taiwanensis]GGE54187.1 pyrroline-5-carboxylate reductase [Priestia taiwanensis]